MTLIAPQAFSYPIAYTDIADIDLVTWGNADDSLRNGSEENRLYIWGQWEHTEFGQCVLCLTKKIDNAILVTTTNGEKYYLTPRVQTPPPRYTKLCRTCLAIIQNS